MRVYFVRRDTKKKKKKEEKKRTTSCHICKAHSHTYTTIQMNTSTFTHTKLYATLCSIAKRVLSQSAQIAKFKCVNILQINVYIILEKKKKK